jgi:hypothetical protein
MRQVNDYNLDTNIIYKANLTKNKKIKAKKSFLGGHNNKNTIA